MEKAQGKRTDKPLPRGGESKSDVLKSAGLSTQAASRCEKIAAIPIADTLSVGKKRVSEWLSRVVKDNKEKRDRKIFDMWLACHTQEEIAEACDCPRKTVDDQIATFGETVLGNQSAKSHAEHATDFDPPIYNIWKQQTKSEGSSHFGNSDNPPSP